MTPFTNLVVAAALHAVPCEYVIDFGAEAAPFAYKMVGNFVTRDGDGLENLMIEFAKNQPADFCRDFLAIALRDNDVVTRPGPGNSLVVVGLARGNKSPIRSVTLTSEKVIPVTVRWVPLVSKK